MRVTLLVYGKNGANGVGFDVNVMWLLLPNSFRALSVDLLI